MVLILYQEHYYYFYKKIFKIQINRLTYLKVRIVFFYGPREYSELVVEEEINVGSRPFQHFLFFLRHEFATTM